MNIGYARISTDGQNNQRQLDMLKSSGAEIIYEDVWTGKSFERPQWKECRRALRKGDRLLVHSLDRLGRNTIELLTICQQLIEDGINIRFLMEGLDSTQEITWNLVVPILSSVATMERARIIERSREGIEAAKRRGVKFGAPRKLSDKDKKRLYELKQKGASTKELMKAYGVGRATVFRVCKEVSNMKDMDSQA